MRAKRGGGISPAAKLGPAAPYRQPGEVPVYLTSDQQAALIQFNELVGRCWKWELRHAWETGIYPGGTRDQASLQQVRNTFGPSWLTRYKLPTMQDNPEQFDDLNNADDYTCTCDQCVTDRANAGKLVRALQVMLLTPHIRQYLNANDPKAVEQAVNALAPYFPSETDNSTTGGTR